MKSIDGEEEASRLPDALDEPLEEEAFPDVDTASASEGAIAEVAPAAPAEDDDDVRSLSSLLMLLLLKRMLSSLPMFWR